MGAEMRSRWLSQAAWPRPPSLGTPALSNRSETAPRRGPGLTSYQPLAGKTTRLSGGALLAGCALRPSPSPLWAWSPLWGAEASLQEWTANPSGGWGH